MHLFCIDSWPGYRWQHSALSQQQQRQPRSSSASPAVQGLCQAEAVAVGDGAVTCCPRRGPRGVSMCFWMLHALAIVLLRVAESFLLRKGCGLLKSLYLVERATHTASRIISVLSTCSTPWSPLLVAAGGQLCHHEASSESWSQG